MRVRFIENFDYTPASDHRILIEYKAGHELTVKREAGLAAIAAGKAEELAAPKRTAPAKTTPSKPLRTKRPAPPAPVASEALTDAPSDAEA